MSPKTKPLFKGCFNLSGQCFDLFSHSINKDKAFLNFINQLSKKTEINKNRLLTIFDGNKDNYLIQEIKK